MSPLQQPLTTFVTAFLDLREDRSKDKSFERCFTLFETVATSGIPIHLFLSQSFAEAWSAERAAAYPNVQTEWLELEDLQTYKEVVAAEAAAGPIALPADRTPHHDTRNFMILMNAKAELVARVAAAAQATTVQFAWIDFSIAHVFRDIPTSLEYLKLLAVTALRPGTLALPGCWMREANFDTLFRAINWRFCGGFFIGDRAAVLKFNSLYRREFPKILVDKRSLTWEVNMWSYLECRAEGWGPGPVWYAADHNDTIVRVPKHIFALVASLTTIPSRVSTECRQAIDSIINQVDTVLLSIPRHYPRFPEAPESELAPPYLSREPYASKVVVHRPSTDFGPATKYIGPAEALAAGTIPKGSWVFVCDDDQEYAATLVARMLQAVDRPGLYQNHYGHILKKTSGGIVHGYVGNFIHSSFLAGLETFPLPPAARFVDDQWMSIACWKRSVPIFSSGIEFYHDIFRVLQGWHEKLGTDSLSSLGNRDAKVAELAAIFQVRFAENGALEPV